MKRQYLGLDILRGLGIFMVVWLHSAFYYFDGLYDLDLNNPPLIVTLIGLLLMFAGLFAMISGAGHTLQLHRKAESGYEPKKALVFNSISGLLILAIGYAYFIFTGAGLVHFETRSMNNSMLVDLIRYGRISTVVSERVLYIDSLVMIGMNILVMGLMFTLARRWVRDKKIQSWSSFSLLSAFGVFLVSLVRIPLYDVYLKAVADKQVGMVLLLNGFVNKNNPLLPYLAFGLMGAWLASMLKERGWRFLVRTALPLSLALLATGVLLYVGLPETMLQRSIDLKWYAIMTAQLGLFLGMMLAALGHYDFRREEDARHMSFVSTFIYRFGVASLTVFFLESVVSACIYRVLSLLIPGLHFGLLASLVYGLVLALCWGFFLMLWERVQFRYGLEHFYCSVLDHFGESEKKRKMIGVTTAGDGR
jgi:surface polysaccharide O-acyltransferase-like enzyme